MQCPWFIHGSSSRRFPGGGWGVSFLPFSGHRQPSCSIVAGEGLCWPKRLCSVQSTRHMDGLLYGVQRCRIPYIEVHPRRAWNVSRVGDHLMFLIFFFFFSVFVIDGRIRLCLRLSAFQRSGNNQTAMKEKPSMWGIGIVVSAFRTWCRLFLVKCSR